MGWDQCVQYREAMLDVMDKNVHLVSDKTKLKILDTIYKIQYIFISVSVKITSLIANNIIVWRD